MSNISLYLYVSPVPTKGVICPDVPVVLLSNLYYNVIVSD